MHLTLFILGRATGVYLVRLLHWTDSSLYRGCSCIVNQSRLWFVYGNFQQSKAKSRLVFKNDSGCSAIKWCILCTLISSGCHIISASLGIGLRLPKRLLGYTPLSTFSGLSSPERNLRSLPFAIFSS
ncbi:hypothetical protein NC653_020409 [Populus alba x Populus x berolinensis]|uniref:Secreted protein n=1 Tax=Populus alba x Populus x berolinensis TaxID=444605 RepID=A0AAD6QDR6_9ROSI|nr:hypothetical protein NC653_020409 [Populus alba x Populus x berolinensis]